MTCWRAAAGSCGRADWLEAVSVQASSKVEEGRESEADSLAEDSPGPQAEGTARRRLGSWVCSHGPLEEGRPPVLGAVRAAGWGCTGSPSKRIVVLPYMEGGITCLRTKCSLPVYTLRLSSRPSSANLYIRLRRS